MDFDLSEKQSERLEALRSLVARHDGKLERGTYSGPLDDALRGQAVLTGPDLELLDRVLLVEEAARLAAPIGATATLLMEPLMGAKRPPGAMAIRGASRESPVRDGVHATSLLEIDESGSRFGHVGAGGATPVESGFGEGYALVSADNLERLEWPHELTAFDAHRLGLVAEIAGASRAALELTSGYLRERKQFGQALAEFQALRHRLSERAVDVEGTSVLARYAGSQPDPARVASAAAYAARSAALLVPELHQLCGARGFLHEFGLARHTMRVEALRVLLGGVRRCAIRHADAAWT